MITAWSNLSLGWHWLEPLAEDDPSTLGSPLGPPLFLQNILQNMSSWATPVCPTRIFWNPDPPCFLSIGDSAWPMKLSNFIQIWVPSIPCEVWNCHYMSGKKLILKTASSCDSGWFGLLWAKWRPFPDNLWFHTNFWRGSHKSLNGCLQCHRPQYFRQNFHRKLVSPRFVDAKKSLWEFHLKRIQDGER